MRTVQVNERAHRDALAAYRRAVRAGALSQAERWLKCAERHYRLTELARRDADERKRHAAAVDRIHKEREREDEENRKFARQVRAARHRAALKAIEDGRAGA